MFIFRSLLILAFFLTACSSPPIIAPVDQLQQPLVEQALAPSPSDEKVLTVQNREALYLCKKGKTVRVTKNIANKKSLMVEFNRISHKLFSSLPKTSKKKYSNIRWIWTEEFNGSHTLRNKSGKILANFCIKQ